MLDHGGCELRSVVVVLGKDWPICRVRCWWKK